MEIFRTTTDISNPRPSAIALGFFDGLHIGHTVLIKRCVACARERGLSADIFTFRDHPKNVMGGETLIPRLMNESDKLKGFYDLGVDRVFDFEFSDDFHLMTPEDFAGELLKEAFSAEIVFCGFNFRFGADASGDPEMLTELGLAYGFETKILDPVYVSDRIVSSSLIRRCINSGEVEPAGRLLGRDYALRGVVEKGRGLGRTFRFPTANFFPDDSMTLPAYGVYVTETQIDGENHPSITNIGVAPTLREFNAVRVESHLLDRDISLYGKKIKVFFKKMLRPEMRFANEEALKRRMAADAEQARQYFIINNR